VAVLGSLARGTGGGVAAYPAFSPALDYGQLANDVRWACSRPQGLEAVARLRVGSGVSVVAYSGSLACRGGPGEGEDVELPALDCDKAFSAQLRLEERRSEGSGEFVVQLAVLLSTPSGARRICVHTLAVPVVSSLAALFRAADLDAQLALACRGAAAELLRGKLSAPALRERSLSDAVSALHAYRRFCASNSAAGQLILPEALKLLPLHGLGLSKSPGLRPGSATCERALWALQQLCAPAAAAAPSCYPRLFALAELPDLAPGEALRSLPPTGWLSCERLEADGAALVEDGRQVVLHLGPRAPPELVQQLFGDAPCGSAHPLPSLDTPRSRALHALLNAIRKQRGAFMRLRVLRRPDSPASEAAFFSMLVEDRSAAGVSYVEHLCSLHRAIQARFT
jgi:protein transport protein SEC24